MPPMFMFRTGCARPSAGIKPSYTIDMGKPAYKLGIAEINVGWLA